MISRILSIPVFILALTFLANSAHAIGIYADIPFYYEFSDCTTDCSYTPSGLKSGVILPGNTGLGIEVYTISVTGGTEISFNMLDLSYLLPIPAVNLTLGIGAGTVTLDTGPTADTGFTWQYWASLGMTIAAVLDIHLGYHFIDASVDLTGGGSADLSGSMISVGAMINF